jgi:hypothetical protein
MKKYLFVPFICLIVLATTNAYAAGKWSSREAYASKNPTQEAAISIDKVIGRLTIYLSLTDTQAKQIKPVIQDYIDQKREITAANKSDNEALLNALDTLRSQTDRKLAQYITDKQIQKFDELQKELPAETSGKKTGRGHKGMGRGMSF